MKKLFNFVVALLSMFTVAQTASALVYNVTVPAGTIECYIAGDFPTNAWSPKDRKLTKVDATHFTIDIADATEAMPYKYCSGPDWAYEEFDGSGKPISNRAYTAADIVVEWKAIFDPFIPPAPKFVDINVFVPIDVVQVYIVGNFNSWNIPTDSTKMTLVESTAEGKIFTIHLWTADAHTLSYKYCAGPSWDYEQKVGDIHFPWAESSVSDVITEFKAIYDPSKLGDINITINVPLGTDSVWFQGSPIGWNFPSDGSRGNGQLCTKNIDGTFSTTVKNVMNMEYRMYNLNDWGHPEVGEADPTTELKPNRVANYPADANLTITVWGWKTPIINSISQVGKDNYNVTSRNMSVSVTNVKSQVELFNAAGQRVVSEKASGTFTSKKLNAGMYIVRVDGVTRKVVVK